MVVVCAIWRLSRSRGINWGVALPRPFYAAKAPLQPWEPLTLFLQGTNSDWFLVPPARVREAIKGQGTGPLSPVGRDRPAGGTLVRLCLTSEFVTLRVE